MNGVLTGLITGLIVLFGLFAAVFVIYRVMRRKITALLVDFVTAPSPAQASPLALIVQGIAATFGAEIAQHLKAAFLGLSSVDSRAERKEAAQSIIAGNSVLGAIAASFPSVGRKIGRNPALAALANLAVTKIAGGGAGENGHHPVQFKF